MADEINELMEKLKFSDEESKRVIYHSELESVVKEFEAWAVGKILVDEKINNEVMYKVFRSLWLTKDQ